MTIDAAGGRKATTRQVRGPCGDDPATVKGNQPALPRAVHAAFERAGEAGSAGCRVAASVEDGHGRPEGRYVTVLRDPDGRPPERAVVGAVVMAGREREVKGAHASTARSYRTRLRGSATESAGYVRGHRGVGNGLRGCLDVTFREGATRTRDANAGANLGVARRMAAALLEPDGAKGRVKAGRGHAALGPKYLKRVLQGFKADQMR